MLPLDKYFCNITLGKDTFFRTSSSTFTNRLIRGISSSFWNPTLVKILGSNYALGGVN